MDFCSSNVGLRNASSKNQNTLTVHANGNKANPTEIKLIFRTMNKVGRKYDEMTKNDS
jgi:hypothetical protein